jgi:SAM-dependent methyltransferase
MISKKSVSGETMDVQTHWENIYGKKPADAVRWYRPHLETSLELIERAAPVHSASIIDIGGGESTLVDDLLARGYQNISVLDISQTAVDVNKRRLGSASEHIRWLVADITKVKLESCTYDVGHDRAVFHFLTAPEERVAYVRQVANTVKPRRACDRKHLRARRTHEMQRSGRCSL